MFSTNDCKEATLRILLHMQSSIFPDSVRKKKFPSLSELSLLLSRAEKRNFAHRLGKLLFQLMFLILK